MTQGKMADLCERPARILKSRKEMSFRNDANMNGLHDSVVKTLLTPCRAAGNRAAEGPRSTGYDVYSFYLIY